MVTALFERLGNLGVLLIGGALLLGGLAGAAVVHHYDRLSTETVASQQHRSAGEPKQANKKHQHSKQNHVGGRDQKGHQGQGQQGTD